MDNMIKKFNEELKYLFPQSNLEVVLLETSLSESKGIDIRGELDVMDFYNCLKYKKDWITDNLKKYFHVEDWSCYNVYPQNKTMKIAFTNAGAKKINGVNMRYFNPELHSLETKGLKSAQHFIMFDMNVYVIFDALICRYKDMLLTRRKTRKAETESSETKKKYTAIITSEPDGKGLDYISDHPWEGNLEATKEFDTVEELYEFEGLFYQLFANKSGRRIGYGMVNDEYPAADIREFENTQNSKQGQLIIISGFSRAGKDAIADGLKELSDNYIYSVSATTRQPRPGEHNEVDYFFITPECFANLEESGGFLESAEYCGNKYGTLASPVVKALEEGRDMILVLETEGAMKVKSLYPTAISFFVAAPAPDLKARMDRTETTEEDRRNRLAQIRKEISMIPKYDYLIMNGNGMLEKNIELVHNIIKGQKAKTSANLNTIEQLRKEY